MLIISLLFQDTDQEDQTCLDEFQECIEEYQECLEVVQICMYEDSSFNHSPRDSGDYDQIMINDVNRVNICASEKRSTNTNELDIKTNLVLLDNQNNKISGVCESGQNYLNVRNDTSTQSDKVPSSYHTQTDEKDGYETCVDESLSEDVCAKTTPANQKLQNIECNFKTEDTVQTLPDFVGTRDFSVKRSVADSSPNFAASEPCLVSNRDNHIFLDSKQDAELKSYDHHNDSLGTDEFFLIQYPPDQFASQTMKCRSEPAVLDEFSSQRLVQKSYIRRLEEYYNDYEHCRENYKNFSKEGDTQELSDDEIFREIVLPMRSNSAPDILDSSFVTLTYDPGPCKTRRKSVFTSVCEHQPR